VAALLKARPVDGCIGLVLRAAERWGISEAGMGAGLKRAEPSLRGGVRASTGVDLTPADQDEGVGRLAVVGREEAPGTEDLAAQRLVLGLRRWLNRELIPLVGGPAVGKVEGQPAA
jgi:hypothetical protein